MNLQIGEAIRNLRIQADITQERLANHLGVSIQAVSRWESGKCYPDVELIAALAIFFGVSTDVILCIDKNLSSEAIDRILNEWRKEYKAGNFEKAFSIVSEGLLSYPKSYKLMVSKAATEIILIEVALESNNEEQADLFVKNSRDLLYKILNECKEENIRAEAREYLIGLEVWLKNFHQFKQLTENLSYVISSKNSMLYRFHPEQSERDKYSQKYIYELLFELVYCLYGYSNSELIDDNTKITFNTQILSLLDSFIGGPIFGEFEYLLDGVYEKLYKLTGDSKYKSGIGKHVNIYNNLPDNFEYNSPFLKGFVFNPQNTIHAIDGTLI